MAERHAAVHAAGALRLQHRLVGMLVEFMPIAHARRWRPSQRQLAREFEESGWLAHDKTSNSTPATATGLFRRNRNQMVQHKAEYPLPLFLRVRHRASSGGGNASKGSLQINTSCRQNTGCYQGRS